jgi:hypothetical protein
MDALTREDLKGLMAKQEGPCASMFMPTHRAGPQIRQDPIRLKNLVRQAEEQLTAVGLRGPEAKELLKAAHALIDDAAFWRRQGNGLALFAARNLFRSYRLPVAFQEFVMVADRFHVKPLLPFFTEDARIYILGISQKQVRLLQATRVGVTDVNLPNVPQGMEETPGYEKPETQLQLQAIVPPGQSGSGIVHGHGSSTDASKDDIVRYFRRIDHAVRQALKDEQTPLVLAGVDYLLPLYREINSYPRLIEEGIIGNPEGLRDDELQHQGLALIEPLFQQARKEAAAQVQEGVNKGRGSDKLLEVIGAASQGRVAALFVPVGVQQWGRFDSSTLAVDLHHEPQPGDEDVLNLAAIQTALHGGKVYAVPPDAMPTDGAVAAVYRY